MHKNGKRFSIKFFKRDINETNVRKVNAVKNL